MQAHGVAGVQDGDGGAGRQDQGLGSGGPGARCRVAGRVPGEQPGAKDQKGNRGVVRQEDERAVGHLVERRREADLAAGTRLDAGAM